MITEQTTKRTYFGRDELDRKIARYVTESVGFFVELGANDGVTQNNSLFFERRGWRGLTRSQRSF